MSTLLFANALYFLFGATMYVGTMWVLKFFLYPTWTALDRDSVGTHFGIPTRRATSFFTGVVPPMFISGIVLVATEISSPLVWLAIVCLAGITFLTGVGQVLIIPINKRVRSGDFADTDELRSLLRRWMLYNDLRFYGSTVTWIASVWYIVAKARTWEAF